jgi:hypothetical protein
MNPRITDTSRIISYLILIMALATGFAQAQVIRTQPDEIQVYCDGIVTNQPVPHDSYVISGVESDDKVVYSQDEYVFLNRGGDKGVRIGDQFQVSREVTDNFHQKWFAYQDTLMKAMGATYADVARVRVVNVQPKTSVALITHICEPIHRGDLIQPFAERPAPTFKAAVKFDQFAPPSGKAKAMIVSTRGLGQLVGTGTIVYVNLGGGQSVKVGDYFRIFRYQGTNHDSVYQTKGTGYRIADQGSAPVPYLWSDLPRDVIGEGIVLRTAPNASTVLVTSSLREIYPGDYVEIE